MSLKQGRKHFSHNIMVFVAVSNLGKRHWCLFSLEPKSTVLITVTSSFLNQGLLSNTQKLSGNSFSFQQDGTSAHHSRQTVAFLSLHVPEFVETENWPSNSPDLNPVDDDLGRTLTACLPSSSHSRRRAPERSPANLTGSRLVKTLSITL